MEVLSKDEFRKVCVELFNCWDILPWIGKRGVTTDELRQYLVEKGMPADIAGRQFSDESIRDISILELRDNTVFGNIDTERSFINTLVYFYGMAMPEDKNVKASYEAIKKLISDDVFVISDSDFKVVDASSGVELARANENAKAIMTKCKEGEIPASLGFRMPGWFSETPDAPLFSKEDSRKELVTSSKRGIKDRLSFFSSKAVSDETTPREDKIKKVLSEREKKVEELLADDRTSNTEKYLRYAMLTPGLDDEYMKTLDAADEMGIEANLVISLLEQPQYSFNKEWFAAYVSQAHKNNTHNFREEVIRDLIGRKYVVIGNVNGIEQKLSFVPYEYLVKLKEEFKDLLNSYERVEGNE